MKSDSSQQREAAEHNKHPGTSIFERTSFILPPAAFEAVRTSQNVLTMEAKAYL